ncbi:MAG: DUF5320 domain-containing protein [Nanobdellota archaeon]
MNIYSIKTNRGENMPGNDRTGPRGLGPATGAGRGPCARGLQRGFKGRFKRFNKHWGFSSITKEEEKEMLKEERDALNKEKEDIEKHLEKLENE